MTNEIIDIETGNGGTSAYIAKPDEVNDDTRPVIIIHEYWGLNDHIKSVANRYAGEGFVAIAPDLYRGDIATNPDKAAELMSALPIEDGLGTIRKTIEVTREQHGFTHFGITGYCMGGTFALYAACEVEGISAAAPFYGDIPPEEKLKDLTVPVVFVSALQDGWITPAKVAELESAADKYELDVDSLKYDADHAFANETRDVYDEDAAQDAWSKVIGFFRDRLG